MEFTDLQMTLIVVLLTAAMLVFFDYLRKQWQQHAPVARAYDPAYDKGVSQQAASLPDFTIDAALWEHLVANVPKQDLQMSGDTASNPELARETPAWPTGMIQQPAFQNLLESRQLFSGLVVSIGINDSDSSMWHSQGLMQSVGSYIAGLLPQKGFSCRTAYDEFIVLCDGEDGVESERRLNHISEQLRDYQPRGACSILFSWDGVHVQDQPLAEAVASAVDRMRQTKQAGSSAGCASAHRTAV
jgi:hypothetical protein